MTKALEKYFLHYAEPECSLLQDAPITKFQQSLIIPAYQEKCDFVLRLEQELLRQQQWLLVIVINQPDDVCECEENIRLQQFVEALYQPVWQNQNLSLFSSTEHNSQTLLVDRYSKGWRIPRKQGVGLARKVGTDLVAELIKRKFSENPWIHSSDADALLPEGYGMPIEQSQNASALVYPFQHLCDNSKLGRATDVYQQSLHNYVNGLRKAGSPYAYHTIGSTLAMHYHAYCQARGFPKRAAGEDFYLLNKLAKIGPVYCPKKPVIEIEARQSSRTPFGTGPAVTRLMQSDPDEAKIFYHPQIFIELKQWLALQKNLFSAFSDTETNSEQLTVRLQRELTEESFVALQQAGVVQAIIQANRRSDDEDTFLRHMNTWFDGFKTLKFVHHLRDHAYPSHCLKHASAQSNN